MMKFIFLFVLSLLLSACNQIPDNLQVPEHQSLLSFEDARKNISANQHLLARWGGVIARVDNLSGKTMLEIVHFPVSSNARPKPEKDQSAGRFRAYSDLFLDPEIYKKGRSVTVLGQISEPEMGHVGEQSLSFPVLNIKALHLWQPKKQKVDVFHHQSDPWPYYRVRPVIINRKAVVKPR